MLELNNKIFIEDCVFTYTHEDDRYKYLTATFYGTSSFLYAECKKTKSLRVRALPTVRSLGYNDLADFFENNRNAIDNWLDGISNGTVIEYQSTTTITSKIIMLDKVPF